MQYLKKKHRTEKHKYTALNKIHISFSVQISVVSQLPNLNCKTLQNVRLAVISSLIYRIYKLKF